MMHYKKGKNEEEELTKDMIPIENLPTNFLWMLVKGGTKVSNVVDYAKKAFDSGEYRSIVWSGSGGGVVKTISCAEIMKRDYSLHQVTRICYRKCEEYWDSEKEGLDQIVVKRRIPCIHILLSLDEIDSNTLGYQHSSKPTEFWRGCSDESNNISTEPQAGCSGINRNRLEKDPQQHRKKRGNRKKSDK